MHSSTHRVQKTRLYTGFAVLLLTAMVSSLTAASTQQTLPVLTSADLVAAVLARNAGLNARRLQALAATQRIATAGRLDDPQLSYSLAPYTVGSQAGTRQLLGLSQRFDWPGKRELESDIAQARASAARYTHEHWRLTLISRSRSLWAQWWFIARALNINDDTQQLLHELQAVVHTQYANALGLQQDLLHVQTAAAHSHHQAILLREQARRIRAQINALLNQPAQTALAPAGKLPGTPVLPATETLRQMMLDADPQLQSARAKTAAARASMQLANKNDWPDFRLNVGFNQLPDDPDKRLQIGLSINIPFDGGKRSGARLAASSDYYSTRDETQQRRWQLSTHMEQQLSQAQQASDVIDLYRNELLPTSEQTLNAARADYEAGRGEFANVIRAEQQLLTAQLELARSQSQRIIAIATIDQLSGGTLWPVTGQTRNRFSED